MASTSFRFDRLTQTQTVVRDKYGEIEKPKPAVMSLLVLTNSTHANNRFSNQAASDLTTTRSL